MFSSPIRFSLFLTLMLSLLISCGSNHLDNIAVAQVKIKAESLLGLAEEIRASEAQKIDIRPGLEKQILFANPQNPEPTEYVLVYFPGFTASHQEMSPVHRNIAETLGANLLLYRFSGTCRTPDAYQGLDAQQWVSDSLEALLIAQQLGEKIIVMGASTGCSIALLADSAQGMYLESAGQAVPEIWSMILASPNLGPADPLAEILLWPGIGRLLVSIVEGPYRSYEVTNPDELYNWDSTHHSDALFPMMRVVDWARELNYQDFETPSLILYDLEDQVVNQHKTLEILSEAPSELVRFYEMTSPDPEHHNMASRIKAPDSIEETQNIILNYIESL